MSMDVTLREEDLKMQLSLFFPGNHFDNSQTLISLKNKTK